MSYEEKRWGKGNSAIKYVALKLYDKVSGEAILLLNQLRITH
jgi:hypothetical protein